MADVSGVDNLSSSSNGSTSLTGIKSAVDNLNTSKQEKGSGVTGNVSTFGASNVLGDSGVKPPTSDIVGKTDTQTLTNKTLTSPAISNPTTTGTDSGTETLQNKTISDANNTIQFGGQTVNAAGVASGQSLQSNGSQWVPATLAQAKFGGTGADGALTISSGTTTIDCANAAVVIKNYSSISITGTGKLAFSNPNTNGTVVILRCTGNVTLTSSSAPMLDASGMGGQGGAAVTASTNTNGNNGSAGTGIAFTVPAGTGSTTGAVGTGGTAPSSFPPYFPANALALHYPFAFCGAGGGSGEIGAVTTATATSGAGGAGGGSLVIECAGSFNFTTASGISAAGKNGGDYSNDSGTNITVGGGGGGAGGSILILYNTLTANSGTVSVAGGTGGQGKVRGSGTQYGGGGGASLLNSGANGTSAGGAATTGGTGGNGSSVIQSNTVFS